MPLKDYADGVAYEMDELRLLSGDMAYARA